MNVCTFHGSCRRPLARGFARPHALLVVVLAVALGVLSRRVPIGFALWDKSLGDALYAVMVFGIVGFVRPNARPATLGIVAFTICFALELFQLTGIPKTLPRMLRIAIGDTFAWHDVACYAVGALVASLTIRWTRGRPPCDPSVAPHGRR